MPFFFVSTKGIEERAVNMKDETNATTVGAIEEGMCLSIPR